MRADFQVRFEIYSLILIHHALLIYAIIFYKDLNISYTAGFISVGVYFLLSRVGGDIGFHRFFSHKSFKTHSTTEYILLLLGSAECKGSSLTWCSHHIKHHQQSDQEADPHSPHFVSPIRVLTGSWPEFKADLVSLRHLLKKPHLLLHKYYFVFNLLVLALFLLLFGIQAAVYLSLPILYSFYIGGLINVFGHKKHIFSYRNFSTPDQSQNSLVLNFLSLGGGFHNNHHASPQNWNTSNHYYELDFPSYLVRCIRIKKKV